MPKQSNNAGEGGNQDQSQDSARSDNSTQNTVRIEIEDKPDHAPVDLEKVRKEAQTQARQTETARLREIGAIAERYNSVKGVSDAAKKAMDEGMTTEGFRGEVLNLVGAAFNARTSASIANGDEGQTKTGNAGHSSVGESFVRSAGYKDAIKSGKLRGVKVDLDGPTQFGRATFSATTDSLTSIQKLPGVPGFLDQQPLRVADLFAQGTTGALTVRYIQEDSYTQAATAVAEAGAKPEATLNTSEVDATVRKIAVYLKVTDEMFADHEQMRSFVDGRLAYMVQSLEDNHLINGTGASNQITGILSVSGINTQVVGSLPRPHDDIYHAINKVRSLGFIEPDAIIMHPNDERDFRLTTDSNGQYYGGGPFSGLYGQGGFTNVSNMWGLRTVTTTAISEGTALVGAFKLGAQIFRRQGLTLETTNSDQDDFINNLVTVRAELRLTLATYKPLAFCSVTSIA